MFHLVSWFVIASFVAIWSLATWALHAVVVWTVSSAGTLSGAGSGAGAAALPDWLAPWLPQEVAQWASQLAVALGPLVDGLLQAAPVLAEGATVAAWVVWGIGSVLLVLLGAGLHLLITAWRRRGGGSGLHAAGASQAAG